jgi:hypothetical protein
VGLVPPYKFRRVRASLLAVPNVGPPARSEDENVSEARF